MERYTVDATRAGVRADVFAAEVTELTRSAVARLMEQGQILLNGAECRKNRVLAVGDELSVTRPEPEPTQTQAQEIPLDVVYEDEDIVVINKPAGMVVHPAAGNPDGTLVNALLHHCGASLSGIGGVIRPGIVHRIDKDTSGLLVVAKNDAAHLSLSEQLKTHAVSRVYFAIVLGNLKQDAGTVDAPIGRHPTDRKKMAVLRGEGVHARDAVTHYTVLERYGQFTLVQCELETGRTHQIRVHMASIGHPLLGDAVYGGGGTRFEATHRALFHGQCLHAGRLRLTHPRTGEQMTFSAPMPEKMEQILEILRRQEGLSR